MAKRDKIIRQIAIQESIQSAGFNIVTCGNCGSVILHEIEDEEIDCPYCDSVLETSDCPDYFYTGMENSYD